jgi:hypothetical protein
MKVIDMISHGRAIRSVIGRGVGAREALV